MIKYLGETSNGRRNEHVEDKRVDGAIAVCVANNGLNDGCFDYDVRDGEIRFRLTSSYRESTPGTALFEYMIAGEFIIASFIYLNLTSKEKDYVTVSKYDQDTRYIRYQKDV